MISTQVLGCRAEIEFDDPGLASTLASLSHGSRPTLPVRRTLRYEVRGFDPYVIHEDGDIVQDVFFHDDVLFVLSSRIQRRAIERFVLSGWVAYHAALARVAGRRLLMLGNSGAGKTTLALRLLVAGHAVEGDELVLERDGQLIAMPRAFHLKRGIERDVPELGDVLDDLPRLEGGAVRTLDPSRLGLGWSSVPGPIDRLIWIAPNHGGDTTIEARPPFNAIRRSLMAIPGWGEPRPQVVASATRLGTRGGHRLVLGDAASAVTVLETLAD